MKYNKHILPWVDINKRIKPTAIVLHWWQAPIWFGGIRTLHFVLWLRKLSAQYTVLANGKVYQLVDSADIECHHARCANNSSIGIELQGYGAKDLDRHQKQFDSTAQLVAALCNQYKISPGFRVENKGGYTFYGITSHKNIDEYCSSPGRKKDVHDEYLQKIVDEVTPRLKL